MKPFDEDWHAYHLALDFVTLLEAEVPRAERDREFARIERLARETVERVDEAVHWKTGGRYRAALRKADACHKALARSALPGKMKERGAHALTLQRALLAGLGGGQRAVPTLH